MVVFGLILKETLQVYFPLYHPLEHGQSQTRAQRTQRALEALLGIGDGLYWHQYMAFPVPVGRDRPAAVVSFTFGHGDPIYTSIMPMQLFHFLTKFK